MHHRRMYILLKTSRHQSIGLDRSVLCCLDCISVSARSLRCTDEYSAHLRVRSHIIGDDIIENVGKYQSCMISKSPIACEQTVLTASGTGSSTARCEGYVSRMWIRQSAPRQYLTCLQWYHFIR